VLVCFDATVLCRALRRPTGPNFRLLELAAEGVVIQGFTTEVVGMEFVRNALEGLGGVQYEIAGVEEFLDVFGALFDPAGRGLNSPALVADGSHARVDGFVSLSVVASAIVVALGFKLGDPLIGLAIALVILRIT
jgi:hypothetical protein